MSQSALLDHEADRLRHVRDALRNANPHEPALTYYYRAKTQIRDALRNLERATIEESRYEQRKAATTAPAVTVNPANAPDLWPPGWCPFCNRKFDGEQELAEHHCGAQEDEE